MKSGIHPEYHEITVVMTDKSEHKVNSCWGKPGDVMRLDIDPLSHPAWTGSGKTQLSEKGRIAKFGTKYAGFGMADNAETKDKASGK